MLIKCRGCGNKIERNIAYRITVKGKNEYYCTEDEYKGIQQEKEIKNKLMEKIYLIFNETITNTLLYKELKLLADTYTYKTIYEYICENASKLEWSMKKNFDSQFGKIKYFTTILKNNLTEYKPKKEEMVKEIDFEFIQMKFKPKNRKKCLNDYINELE